MRSKFLRAPLPPPHVLSALVTDSPAFAELMKIEQRLDWTLMRKKAEINDALGRPIRVSEATTMDLYVELTLAGEEDAPCVCLKHRTRSAMAGRAATYKRLAGQEPIRVANRAWSGRRCQDVRGRWRDASRSRSTRCGPEERGGFDYGERYRWLGVEGRGTPFGRMFSPSTTLTSQSGNARLDKTRKRFSTFLRSAIVEFDNREAPTFPEGNIVEVCQCVAVC
jgi:SWI/SNF-related matrix-associated actin-dependent regulator of chromatin subfamily D